MIVAIHQPDYIPWLGYYYKIAHCDKFVYLDDAQYSNTAAHNFNDIKTPQGAFRLKIPVIQSMGDLINEVKMRDSLNWKDKHLRTIEMNYKKATHFDEVFPIIVKTLMHDYSNIADLNMSLNSAICTGFGIQKTILRSSELKVTSVRQERIIDICKALAADEYLSGNGARAYQKEEDFCAQGIKLSYLDYKPIQYTQLWGEFLPCMSVLDYIFNCGFNWEYVETQISSLLCKVD